jgi:hypothetical protein
MMNGFDTSGLTPQAILNAMSPALNTAASNLSSLLSNNFDATDSNAVILLQIYTEQLNALVTATSNSIKSVYENATAVIRNIS